MNLEHRSFLHYLEENTDDRLYFAFKKLLDSLNLAVPEIFKRVANLN